MFGYSNLFYWIDSNFLVYERCFFFSFVQRVLCHKKAFTAILGRTNKIVPSGSLNKNMRVKKVLFILCVAIIYVWKRKENTFIAQS